MFHFILSVIGIGGAREFCGDLSTDLRFPQNFHRIPGISHRVSQDSVSPVERLVRYRIPLSLLAPLPHVFFRRARLRNPWYSHTVISSTR
jgi:hypothetical protein